MGKSVLSMFECEGNQHLKGSGAIGFHTRKKVSYFLLDKSFVVDTIVNDSQRGSISTVHTVQCTVHVYTQLSPILRSSSTCFS